MARNALMTAVGVASLGLAMSAAQAETLFTFGNSSDSDSVIDPTMAPWSKTLDGISLTIKGEYAPRPDEDNWSDASVTQNRYGFGVLNDSESPHPDDPYVDNAGSFERLLLFFNPAVALQSMTFTFADVSDRVQVGLFNYDGDGDGTLVAQFQLGTTPGEGGGTSAFTLGSADLGSFIASDQFYVAALNPGSTGFRLASIGVNAAVVPLPAAVWGGMALMGMLGIGRLHKRR